MTFCFFSENIINRFMNSLTRNIKYKLQNMADFQSSKYHATLKIEIRFNNAKKLYIHKCTHTRNISIQYKPK